MTYCSFGARLLATIAFALPAIASAHAQSDYPSRSLTIIVAVSPGSQADVFARLIGHQLAARLGKSVIVWAMRA